MSDVTILGFGPAGASAAIGLSSSARNPYWSSSMSISPRAAATSTISRRRAALIVAAVGFCSVAMV